MCRQHLFFRFILYYHVIFPLDIPPGKDYVDLKRELATDESTMLRELMADLGLVQRDIISGLIRKYQLLVNDFSRNIHGYKLFTTVNQRKYTFQILFHT